MKPFDLHMHSRFSDGTDEPDQIVSAARDAGFRLIALTDHDCVDGVHEACEAGARLGVKVLPALEMDSEWPRELHIIGYNVDVTDAELNAALETARMRREKRNAEILRLLEKAGFGVSERVYNAGGLVTRLHIAKGLVEAGYAQDTHDAFMRFLRPGCPGYCRVTRFTPEEVISLIRHAGGTAVWAHPFHTTNEVHKLALQFKEYGLAGLEAYHPSASEGQSVQLVSVARQTGLFVTCGSDYHGANRPAVTLGCTWRDTPALETAYAYFAGEKRS